MSIIFTVVTNLPEDTTELSKKIAEYLAKKFIEENDPEIIDLLIERLEAEEEKEANSKK